MLWWIFGGLVTGAWLPWLWAAGLLLAVWILLGLQAWYGDCWRPNIGRALLLLLAVCWAALAVQQEQSRQLPETEAGTIWLISGRVQGLPIVRERSFFGGEPVITAYFVLDELSLPEDFPVPLRALAVNWSQADPAQLAPGHRITAQLELRTPRGRVNSEGFDSERNAFARGIHARARLQELLAVEPGSDWLQQYRLQLTQRMQQALLPFENARALIPATVNGDWRDTTPSQWRLLQETGTAHLISISGFHITLVAGMVWWFSRWLLAGLLCRSSGLLSAQRLAIIPAWLAALGYTALAGFPVPALRALFMASVAMLMLASLHRSAPLRSLLLTAVLLLLPNPLAALDTSFWLSYGAVAWLGLIHANGIRHPISFAASMTLIFGVWVAWGFGQWNLSALPANLLLIPLYSFCIVPLALLGALASDWLPGSGWLLWLVGQVFELSWRWMQWLTAAPDIPLPQNLWQTLMLSAALMRLLFRAVPGPLWIVWPLLLPWLWPSQTPLPLGVFELTVFDVGQAQMTVIRTRQRLLVYDTGGAFEDDSNAQQILLPWLKRQRQWPDAVVVSHGDLDHAGGAPVLADWLQRQGRSVRWLAGEPERLPGLAEACQRGERWSWDGVYFEFLWPEPTLDIRRANNRSCVLKVTSPDTRLLLAGDIEAPVEHWLVAKEELASHWLLSPHHGSQTSSSYGFLRAVQPHLVIVSAGYHNRYGHPATVIRARHEALGIPLLVTTDSGQLRLRSDDHKSISREREQYPFPWRVRVPVLE